MAQTEQVTFGVSKHDDLAEAGPITALSSQKAKQEHPPLAVIDEFGLNKHNQTQQRAWDLFYKEHTTNHYADRHWLLSSDEFPCLRQMLLGAASPIHLLEAGCGVGNAIVPLLQACPHLFVHAFDISPRAVNLVKTQKDYDVNRTNVFQHDLVQPESNLRQSLDFANFPTPEAGVDIALAIFVLSACNPSDLPHAFQQLAQCLRPGGLLLFRDYAEGDYTQAKLQSRRSLRYSSNGNALDKSGCWFQRGDGTGSYFFSETSLLQLAAGVGLELVSMSFVNRPSTNRKTELNQDRKWLQATWAKS